MKLVYGWYYDFQHNFHEFFDDYHTAKKNMIDTLQDMTNQGGYPRSFQCTVYSYPVSKLHSITPNYMYAIYQEKGINLFLKPTETLLPKFRYIDYKGYWKVYGDYDESEIIDVYSHFYKPTKVKKSKLPRVQIKDDQFDKYIYDIVPSPNTIHNNEIQVNDFKIYETGDKIKVLHNGRYKTYIVDKILNRYIINDSKEKHKPIKDISVSLWYSKDDQYLVDKLTPHILDNNISIDHNTYIDNHNNFSHHFNLFMSNCNVILYSNNSINDPDLNQNIGSMLTMDIPVIVILVETPKPSKLNTRICISSKLYPEEINEIISNIKDSIYNYRYYSENISHLTQYPINNAEILFRSVYKWSTPNLIQLIYNRYNNDHLQDAKTLKIIDKVINDNKHIIPNALYNQVIKHAKITDERKHNMLKKSNRNKTESHIDEDGELQINRFDYTTKKFD